MYPDDVHTLIFVVDISSPFSWNNPNAAELSSAEAEVEFRRRTSLFVESITKAFERIVTHYSTQGRVACCFKLFNSRHKSGTSFYRRTSLYDAGVTAFDAFRSALAQVYATTEKSWCVYDCPRGLKVVAAINEAYGDVHLENSSDDCSLDCDWEKSDGGERERKERATIFVMARSPRTFDDLSTFLDVNVDPESALKVLQQSEMLKHLFSLTIERRIALSWIDTVLAPFEQSFQQSAIKIFIKAFESALLSFRFRTLEAMVTDRTIFPFSLLLGNPSTKAPNLTEAQASECRQVTIVDPEGVTIYTLNVIAHELPSNFSTRYVPTCVAPKNEVAGICETDSSVPALLARPADDKSAKVFAASMMELARAGLVLVLIPVTSESTSTHDSSVKSAGFLLKPVSGFLGLLITTLQTGAFQSMESISGSFPNMQAVRSRRKRTRAPKRIRSSDLCVVDINLLDCDLNRVCQLEGPAGERKDYSTGSQRENALFRSIFEQVSTADHTLNRKPRDWSEERVSRFKQGDMSKIHDAIYSIRCQPEHQTPICDKDIKPSFLNTLPESNFLSLTDAGGLSLADGEPTEAYIYEDDSLLYQTCASLSGNLISSQVISPSVTNNSPRKVDSEMLYNGDVEVKNCSRAKRLDTDINNSEENEERESKSPATFQTSALHGASAEKRNSSTSDAKSFTKDIEEICRSIARMRKDKLDAHKKSMMNDKKIMDDMKLVAKAVQKSPTLATKRELLANICLCLMQSALRIEYCARKNPAKEGVKRPDPLPGKTFKSAKRILLLVQYVVHSCESRFESTDTLSYGVSMFAEIYIKPLVGKGLPRSAKELCDCIDVPTPMISQRKTSAKSRWEPQNSAYKNLICMKEKDGGRAMAKLPSSGLQRKLLNATPSGTDGERSALQTCGSQAGDVLNEDAGRGVIDKTADNSVEGTEKLRARGQVKRLGSMTEQKTVSLLVRAKRRSRKSCEPRILKKRSKTRENDRTMLKRGRVMHQRSYSQPLPSLPSLTLDQSMDAKEKESEKKRNVYPGGPIVTRSRSAKFKAFREGSLVVADTPPP